MPNDIKSFCKQLTQRLNGVLLTQRLNGVLFNNQNERSLQRKFILEYTQRVKEALNHFSTFSRENEIMTLLEDYLKSNLIYLKTAFGYTAIIEEEVTKVLCEVAFFLANKHNQLNDIPETYIDYLLPGLNLPSNSNDYPNLCVTLKTKWAIEDQDELNHLRIKLTNILEPNFAEEETDILNIISNLEFRINNSRLESLNNTEELIAQLETLKRTNPAIVTKMKLKEEFDKKSALEQTHIKYLTEQKFIQLGVYTQVGSFLIPIIPPERLLKTHIVSEDKKCLIPISVLLDKNFEFKPYLYINEEEPSAPANLKISAEEKQRLYTHSEETRALGYAREQLASLMEQGNNLLGNLSLLIKYLKINDAHGGRGNEENAAGGAYQAIISFKEYYFPLPVREKNKIPQAIRNEIELLIACTFDPEVNIRATTNLDTCIGTRREKLEVAMKGQEATLSSIACTGRSVTNLIEMAKAREIQCLTTFSASLNTDRYSGQEIFPVTISLLEQIQFSWKPNYISDLEDMMQLDPQLIFEFATRIGGELIAHLFNRSLDDLYTFILNHPIEKLRSLFSVSYRELIPNICYTSVRCKTLFDLLNDYGNQQKFKEVLFWFLLSPISIQTPRGWIHGVVDTFTDKLKLLLEDKINEFNAFDEMHHFWVNEFISKGIFHYIFDCAPQLLINLIEKLPQDLLYRLLMSENQEIGRFEMRGSIFKLCCTNSNMIKKVIARTDTRGIERLLEQNSEVLYEAIKLPEVLKALMDNCSIDHFRNCMRAISRDSRISLLHHVLQIPKIAYIPKSFMLIFEALSFEERIFALNARNNLEKTVIEAAIPRKEVMITILNGLSSYNRKVILDNLCNRRWVLEYRETWRSVGIAMPQTLFESPLIFTRVTWNLTRTEAVAMLRSFLRYKRIELGYSSPTSLPQARFFNTTPVSRPNEINMITRILADVEENNDPDRDLVRSSFRIEDSINSLARTTGYPFMSLIFKRVTQTPKYSRFEPRTY